MAVTKKKQSPLERARERFRKLQDGDKNSDYFNPATGKNVVRVLPGPKEDDDWYVEAAYHFKLGPNQITCLCPAFVGRKCPACAKGAKLRKEAYRLKDKYEKGGEKSLKLKKAMDKAFRQAANYKARNRFYMNVVPLVMGKETMSGKEVKILAAGPQIMNGIFTFYTDTDEYGNVLDLKKGRDFIITKKVTGKKAWDIDYEVKLRDRDRCKPVHPNRMKDLNKLTDLVEEYPSFEEVLAIMEGRSEGSDESSDDEASSKARSKLTSKKRRNSDDEDDEDLEDEDDTTETDDEDEEDERPRKGKKSKKKPSRDDDDDEEEDEDDESDSDAEDDGDSDDEDDEDEDVDGEEDDDADDEDDDDVDGDEDRPRKSKLKDKLRRKARR
jgi:hypothetical protein